MHIKPQDIVVLAKLIAHQGDKNWSQNSIAFELCLSPSQINSAFKRLVVSGLITPYHPPGKPQAILQACEEFFIHALKYIFPAKLGEISRGVPTSYSGPSLKNQIVAGSDPIPVWPYGEGEVRGVSLKPLYSSVPESVTKHPDPLFYDLLTLLDAIRSGRTREKQIAIQMLSEILKSRINKKEENKDNVYLIYDEIIDWFDSHRNKDLTMEKFYLNFLQKYLPHKGTILDVGCGTGEPIAQFLLQQGYKVTGIDASKKMIGLCKQRFPTGKWLLADMRTLDLQEQFHAVIAWHSFFHLPHDDQRTTLKLLTSLVSQNGLLIFTSGPEYSEVWSDNGGHDLYHASLSSDEYTKILTDNNFKILAHKIRDPECGEATVWVAQKG